VPGQAVAGDDHAIAGLRAEIEHLRRALGSRAVIEQAKGILAERTRCTPEEAFALLDQASQRRNVKLRLIAAEIVAELGGAVHPPEEGHG
jgi:AmiR/NasT family two-component response regulator